MKQQIFAAQSPKSLNVLVALRGCAPHRYQLGTVGAKRNRGWARPPQPRLLCEIRSGSGRPGGAGQKRTQHVRGPPLLAAHRVCRALEGTLESTTYDMLSFPTDLTHARRTPPNALGVARPMPARTTRTRRTPNRRTVHGRSRGARLRGATAAALVSAAAHRTSFLTSVNTR